MPTKENIPVLVQILELDLNDGDSYDRFESLLSTPGLKLSEIEVFSILAKFDFSQTSDIHWALTELAEKPYFTDVHRQAVRIELDRVIDEFDPNTFDSPRGAQALKYYIDADLISDTSAATIYDKIDKANMGHNGNHFENEAGTEVLTALARNGLLQIVPRAIDKSLPAPEL